MANLKPIFIWKKAPFTRLLPALIAGILIGHYLSPPVMVIASCFIFISLVLLFLGMQKAGTRYFSLPLTGFCWMVLICIAGMLATHFTDVKHNNSWHGHYVGKMNFWKARIISPPEEKENSYKVTADIISGYYKDSLIAVSGKALIYFSKNNSPQLHQGTVFFMRNKLQPIRSSGNPGSFDYRQYMANRQIFFQAFLKEKEWAISIPDRIGLLDQWINMSLAYENALFEKYLDGDQEIALAKALMTGNRSELDKDLVQAYSDAGVVHIMSISGLHIGLIYIFLLQLVRILPRISKNKIIKAIIILGGIWFFAILTGCSPSVMRSAVMFTCLHAGTLINRKIPTYNFWSASAFLLLCFDPMLLWNVGFQLSYTAVLGILVAQKPIYHQLSFQNKIVDYCWQLISVSLAAQLFTLPVCLYYFHQLPLLFIIANLVAIPLSSIGLWLCILLVMTGWLPILPKITGAMITYTFQWLNEFIHYMDSFIFTVWNGIFLNLSETFLLLIVVVFITHWLLYKNKSALKVSLVTACLLIISFSVGYWKAAHQHRMIVYNVNAANAIDIISGKKYFEIFDGNTKSRNTQLTLKAARQYFGVEMPDTSQEKMLLGKNEFYPGKVPFMIIRSGEEFHQPPKQKINLKVIFLTKVNGIQIADLAKFFDADIYIFSPLNKRYQIEKWKKECEDLHLRSHDISAQGAIVMDF